MFRPLLSLSRHAWQVALPLVALAAGLRYVDSLPSGDRGEGPLLWLLVFLPLAALTAWRSRWVVRLAWRTWRFRTSVGPHFILHYDPGLGARQDLRALLASFESDLGVLGRRFGFALGGRHPVFLFARREEVAWVFRGPFAGYAIGRLICIADDAGPEEVFRHELCHLFAFHWNVQAPMLLSEGLPTWFQVAGREVALHAAALAVLRGGKGNLSRLLSRRPFHSEQDGHASYMLAGSFTGYLIRHYGWPMYGRLFRAARGTRFGARFKEHYGQTLEEAESHWGAWLESTAATGAKAS
jgi:hypothetical protein